MNWYSLLQVFLTFLLAFFSIIPEFKANNSKEGERRKFIHRIILIVRKPIIRVLSLILLVVGLFFTTQKIQTINSKKSTDDADQREQKRSRQTFQLQKAITDKLNAMGYQYDSIRQVLVRIKDSVNIAKKTFVSDKPLLVVIFRVDSTGTDSEDIYIEMRAAGANISDVDVMTSIAAIANSKPTLVYKNQRAFANHNVLGKDIEEMHVSLNVKSTKNVTDYIIYQYGTYKDIDNNTYIVDKIYFTHKHPWTSSNIQMQLFKPAKDFFLKDKKFEFKY